MIQKSQHKTMENANKNKFHTNKDFDQRLRRQSKAKGAATLATGKKII